jgi:hypothetical protein
MSEAVNINDRLQQLERARWILLAFFICAFALAWVTGPLIWALAIVALILLVRNEWVIHQGRRVRG